MFESRGNAALKSSHWLLVYWAFSAAKRPDLANGQCYGKQTSGGSFVIDGLQIATESEWRQGREPRVNQLLTLRPAKRRQKGGAEIKIREKVGNKVGPLCLASDQVAFAA
jgi:hypothetical protein